MASQTYCVYEGYWNGLPNFSWAPAYM